VVGLGGRGPAWRQALWGCCPRRSVCPALRPGADQGDKRVATWRLVCPALDAGANQERTWRFGCHTHKQAAQVPRGA